jgi:hypothetical protein
VRPSRRLTAREQSLPWAMPSLSSRPPRVNRPALAVGTPAAAVACSKDVNAGSCPNGPRRGTVARPANTPLGAGDAGMPVNATGPPPTANNAGANRPDAIAVVGNSARLALSRRLHLPNPSPSPPWSSPSPLPRPIRRSRLPRPARASARTKFRKNPGDCPATGRVATSSSSPRRVRLGNTSVPAAAARRYDASDSGRPDKGNDGGAVDGPNAAISAGRPRQLR